VLFEMAPVQNLDPLVYNCASATEVIMSTTADRLASEIRDLADAEKLRLVDAILTDLDKPDPEIDRIWAEEARKRWAAYKAGEIPTVAYEDVMAKYTRE
jgi:putative addiction module component (TIGR02574 family)